MMFNPLNKILLVLALSYFWGEAQPLKQEFEELWKSKDVYQKAHALTKLAQINNLDSAKLLLGHLGKISKSLDSFDAPARAHFLEKTTRTVASFKQVSAIQYLLKNAFDIQHEQLTIAILQGLTAFQKEETSPVFLKGLKAPSPEIRLASIIALQKNTAPEISDTFFKLLKEPDPSWKVRAFTAAILMQRNYFEAYSLFVQEFLSVGQREDPESIAFLVRFLKPPEDGSSEEFFAPIRQMAILALQQKTPSEAFHPILKLLNDSAWQVRVCVTKALIAYDNPSAIEPLIEQLEKEKGRLVDDIEKALHHLTGETHHGNPVVWRVRFKSEWERWKQKEKKNPPPKPPDRRLRGTKEYYPSQATTKEASIVLTTNSERVLYVVDLSGSMANKIVPETASEETRRLAPSKIRLLKNKLIQTLPKLRENQSFSMILFHEKIFCWKKELVPATKPNIQEAQEFLQQMTTDGNTDTFAALEKAFYLEDPQDFYKNYQNGPDVVFLISDGLPTMGKYKIAYWNEKNYQPSILRFLDAIEEINRLRCIKIHTIGIPPDPLDDLLGGLAVDSGGTYQYWE